VFFQDGSTLQKDRSRHKGKFKKSLILKLSRLRRDEAVLVEAYRVAFCKGLRSMSRADFICVRDYAAPRCGLTSEPEAKFP
jgi:hypothetical protein